MDGPRVVTPAELPDPMEFVVERAPPQLPALDEIGRQEMFAPPAVGEPPQPRIHQHVPGQFE